MIWGAGKNIYLQENREKMALKKYGLDRDYTASEMNKKFFDLCTDFGLTKEGEIIPEGQTVLCDDFWGVTTKLIQLKTKKFHVNFGFFYFYFLH